MVTVNRDRGCPKFCRERLRATCFYKYRHYQAYHIADPKIKTYPPFNTFLSRVISSRKDRSNPVYPHFYCFTSTLCITPAKYLLLFSPHLSTTYMTYTQWAGKTIALGTFATAEAEEKCQRAKALTKTWRQTLRPKPSREWVMAELERHGVRVVSGRRGTSGNAFSKQMNASGAVGSALENGGGEVTATSRISTLCGLDIHMNAVSQAAAAASLASPAMVSGDADASRRSLSALTGEMGSSDANSRASLDHLGLAASLMSSGRLNDSGSDPASSSAVAGVGAEEMVAQCAGDGRTPGSSPLDVISFLQDEVGFFDNANVAAETGSKLNGAAGGLGAAAGSTGVARRPFVGGGAAAAYEAARADHYRNLAEKQRSGVAMPKSSSLVESSAMAGLEPSVRLRQQYEMLKLHQMNLLQEIQETTMMMNLYQQQMLQHQHQQHQLHQQRLQQQQQQQQQITAITSQEMSVMGRLSGSAGAQHYEMQQQEENQHREKQTEVGNFSNQTVPNETTDKPVDEIRKLKEEIAEQERKMRELAGESGNGDVSSLAGDVIKRCVSDQESEQYTKRSRIEPV
mmetsp:Transcript_20067/g.40868  ORF Transcript_20067/g.40868 Transcript_20067/m.40868 type:complete len:571 (-) Transcript_20067:129-1841(-)